MDCTDKPAVIAGPIAAIPNASDVNTQRRQWLGKAIKTTAGVGMLSLMDPFLRASAWAAGSD
ncbi:MAG TPA: hypothetical protein VIP51_03345, partial [Eoetvoesiella sp.]